MKRGSLKLSMGTKYRHNKRAYGLNTLNIFYLLWETGPRADAGVRAVRLYVKNKQKPAYKHLYCLGVSDNKVTSFGLS